MTRKTRSEKIASTLRSLRQSQSYSSEFSDKKSTTSVFSKADALKTFITTAFVLSVIFLVYVLQIKGFIR